MLTLGDVWAVGKPLESGATTLATSSCSGGKYSIPIPHPHRKQSDPKLTLDYVPVPYPHRKLSDPKLKFTFVFVPQFQTPNSEFRIPNSQRKRGRTRAVHPHKPSTY